MHKESRSIHISVYLRTNSPMTPYRASLVNESAKMRGNRVNPTWTRHSASDLSTEETPC